MQLTGTRKMDLADLMDAAGKLYVENLGLFIGVYAVAMIIAAILTYVGHGAGFLASLASLAGSAALINAIAARAEGRPMGIADAYTSLTPSTYLRFIVASILYFLAVVVGLILLIVPGIYLMVKWVFVPEAVIIDHAGIGQSFTQSSRLTEGNWWRILVYGLVLFILFAVLSAVGAAFGGAGGVVASLIELFAVPFLYAILVDLYFNLREVKGAQLVNP
ncbi:MAG TPA: hypothetical protein VFB58_03925 [Chloroflexota bacterium]|nr:hypothetical protein [Chloroflexota bacterium]